MAALRDMAEKKSDLIESLTSRNSWKYKQDKPRVNKQVNTIAETNTKKYFLDGIATRILACPSLLLPILGKALAKEFRDLQLMEL